MSTSPRGRLDQLFAGQALPDITPTSAPHFSELELQEKTNREKSLNNKTSQETLSVTEVVNSSDDGYLGSSTEKPPMGEAAKPKETIVPAPIAIGYSEHTQVSPKQPLEYLPRGKPSTTDQDKGKSVMTVDSEDDGEALPGVTKQFCQFGLAAKFPYKYMRDGNDRVSRHFFADNKFFNRTWDVYYLNPPSSMNAKPILLVPFTPMQQLVSEISKKFKIDVFVPKFPFTLSFRNDGTPQPQKLGTTHSRSDFNDIQNNISPADAGHGECPEHSSPATKQRFDAFREMCEDALTAGRKGKASKTKRREADPLLSVRDWIKQLRKSQRYLGLRPETVPTTTPDANLSWAVLEKYRTKEEVRTILEPLDVDKPTAWRVEKETVIICFDIEAYESDHSLITEIGVSTLDTLDLVGLAPGPNGVNWHDQIRSRHFRIKGREHLVNHRFCIGNPESFQFGTSEFVGDREAAVLVDSCFEWPFSVQYKHARLVDPWEQRLSQPEQKSETTDGGVPGLSPFDVSTGPTNAEQNMANQAAVTAVMEGIGRRDSISHAMDMRKTSQPDLDPTSLQRGPKDRNIILLGHDIQADLDYLKTLGSKIFSPSRDATDSVSAVDNIGDGATATKVLSSVVATMDTAPLYRVLKQEAQNRSLASIRSDLGLPCYFMHNGGNDARYTMECFVSMAVKARLEDDKVADDKGTSAVEEDPIYSSHDHGVDHVEAAVHASAFDAPSGEQEELNITTMTETMNLVTNGNAQESVPTQRSRAGSDDSDDEWEL